MDPDNSSTPPSLVSKRSARWLLALSVLVLLAAGGWVYLHRSTLLEQQITEAKAAMDAESRRAPFRTLEFYDAEARMNGNANGSSITGLFHKPDSPPPGRAGEHDLGIELRGRAEVAESAAAETGFKDADLNAEAVRAIGEWHTQVSRGNAAK
jgi:hypothetical protein